MTAPRKNGYLERVMPGFMMPCGLYGVMLAIWHYSPFYQRRFPLHRGKTRDYWRYVAWCATDGHHHYPLLLEIPGWEKDLAAPIALPEIHGDIWEGGYSVKMFLYAVTRYGGTFGAILGERGARHRVARHYWRGGRHLLKAPPVSAWQIQWVKRRFGTIEGFLETLRKPKLDGGKTTRDLIGEFGLEDLERGMMETTATDLAETTEPVRLHESLRGFEVRLPSFLMRPLSLCLPWLRTRPSEFQLASVAGTIDRRRGKTEIRYPFGVNLYGYARGELGIGEDVRTVAEALEHNGIPLCIVDIRLGNHISQEDRSAEQWISDRPLYGINLFCQTGIEMTRFITKEGTSAFDGRYTIGLWPWELPEWPESCRHTYALVDELWGISTYAGDAYKSFPGPVHPMGLPVVMGEVGDATRRDFNLPADDYLYLFAFDLHSRTYRKNPLGLIRAFQRAYPRGSSEKVGLVIKVNHPETLSPDWIKIRAIAKRDARIHLIEKRMRKPEVMALTEACDCYVSLHRAEGFGRGIAEALLLGRQVITTGWSGNMDFCHEPRVALVRSKPTSVGSKEYFWSHGQQWADPDLDHAAELMRKIRQNPRDVAVGQPDLSPATVGSRYAQRLHEIWEVFEDKKKKDTVDQLARSMPVLRGSGGHLADPATIHPESDAVENRHQNAFR
jgi:hypothetical protein